MWKILKTKNFLITLVHLLTFWHRSSTFNSNKSPTWCNNFSVYPDVCLQLNMFRTFSRPSSGAQWLQWQPLVLPLYRGDSRAVFVVGPTGRQDNKLENCCIWLVIYLNCTMMHGLKNLKHIVHIVTRFYTSNNLILMLKKLQLYEWECQAIESVI